MKVLWAGDRDEIIPTWEGQSVVVYVCEARLRRSSDSVLKKSSREYALRSVK